MVVANASNAAVVSDALAERLRGFSAVLDDRILATGLVAIQGPRSIEILQPLADIDLGGAPLLRDRRGRASPGSRRRSPAPATPARTGSSCSSTRSGPASCGTPCSPAAATRAARSASAPATRSGSRPGCRSTATSWTATTTPFEAGLGRVVKLAKPGDFIGSRRPREGRARRPGAGASSGWSSRAAGSPATGTPSTRRADASGSSPGARCRRPWGPPIAMAYVAPADAEPGTMLDVEIRGARVPARVVPLPFYRRPG